MFTKLGLVLALLAPLSVAGLIGQTVTGNLSYGGGNLYDPANLFVPATGYLNSADSANSATVIIGHPALEFGYQTPNPGGSDAFYSVDLTDTQLVFSHTVGLTLGEGANTHTFTFANNVIANVTLAGNDNPAYTGSVSFTANSITVSFDPVLSVGGLGIAAGPYVTTFDITETPEPSTLLLGGLGLAGLMAWRRQRLQS